MLHIHKSKLYYYIIIILKKANCHIRKEASLLSYYFLLADGATTYLKHFKHIIQNISLFLFFKFMVLSLCLSVQSCRKSNKKFIFLIILRKVLFQSSWSYFVMSLLTVLHVVVSSCLLLFAFSYDDSEGDVFKKFNAYIQKFNKTYEVGTMEFKKRESIFEVWLLSSYVIFHLKLINVTLENASLIFSLRFHF